MSENLTPTSEAAVPDKTVLVEQYKLLIDIYKFYFELVLKYTVFLYAVTGGILSFYLTQKNEGFMRLALVFPILMNVTFAIFCFFGSYRVSPISEEIERVTGLLNLDAFPDADFLKFILRVSVVLYVITAIGLTVLSFWRPAI